MRIQVPTLIAIAALGAAAQDVPFFPQPSYFKQHFATTPSKVELEPPVTLSDYVVDKKLELSLKATLDLAMANNPDVVIQKVSVERQMNAIQRAFSIFDPVLTGQFNSTHRVSSSAGAYEGAQTVKTLSQPFSLNYNQMLGTGTSYSLGFQNTKTSTSIASYYNPNFNTTMTLGVSQPLIRNRGPYITRLPITVARSALRSSQFNLEDQLIQLLTQAELAYWNVVEARENLRVQEKALELADVALKRSKRELELGAISSLEIFQPEANYANAEISVTQARYRLEQAEDALRRQIGADVSPSVKDLPLVLTETVTMPTSAPAIDKEKTVAHAIARRPDLKATLENQVADDLNIRLADNALRPDLRLTAQYGGFGQAGVLRDSNRGFVPISSSGFGSAFWDTFGFGSPTYGLGLQMNLPIKDRKAAADLADAVLSKKLDKLREKSIAQNVRLQVLQGISQIENSKASVEMAKVARDLAQKRVDAEQKRYELGTTTIFFVLAAQNDLTAAESVLVRESINYRRNLLNLSQRTGDLLEERGIKIQ